MSTAFRLAGLFPGQGSQSIGMGMEMARSFPAAEATFAQAETILPGLQQLIAEGPIEELTLTANLQPALLTTSVACYRAWQSATQLNLAYAAGHSLGEYSAHVTSGSLALTDALQLVRRRGELMQQAVPAGLGAMAAIINAEPQQIAEVCQTISERVDSGRVEIANLNAPNQTVISGEKDAVSAACQQLKEKGARNIPLKVSAPFHCSLMQPAREGLTPDLQSTPLGTFQFPVLANVTADLVNDVWEIPALLSEQITGSVRWVETIQYLDRLGTTLFLEFGPGTALRGLVERILPNATIFNIHTPKDIEEFKEFYANSAYHRV